ncbi:MAG: hypothetical protein VX642_09670 [Bdellovibrionota bacterium]|nr:hypothetical protein [Bdellovibrionota bacterium]
MNFIKSLFVVLLLCSQNLSAIECSVASEEDLANYHDFLEKVGRFVYSSSNFSRDSQDTRSMASILYSHPHVKKHYRPRFANYNEDIKSLLSATYRNRNFFIRESPGSKLFIVKVEQAMFKVDTSITEGLLNEANRVEQKPKEWLSPEVIGKSMSAKVNSQKIQSQTTTQSTSSSALQTTNNPFGAQEILAFDQMASNLSQARNLHYMVNLKAYYLNFSNLKMGELTTDVVTTSIYVKDLQSLVDVLISYVNLYSSKGWIDNVDITAFSKAISQELLSNSRYSQKVAAGMLVPDFSAIIHALYARTGVFAQGTSSVIRLVDFQDYTDVVKQMADADLLKDASGKVLEGLLFQ